ncbi:hypothetical protein QEN19_003402 [Hanseniaspora menglaensis]
MSDTFYTPNKKITGGVGSNYSSSSRTMLNSSGRITKPSINTNKFNAANNFNDINSNYNSMTSTTASNNVVGSLNINDFGFGMSLEQQLLFKMNNNLARVMANKNTKAAIASKAPLELASDHLTALMEYDNTTPGLINFLESKETKYNFASENNEDESLGAFEPFINQKSVPLPDELLEQINLHKSHQKLTKNKKADFPTSGIFSEIERCWFILGNKLFLWNYNKPESFQILDNNENEILQVSLVKPKESCFVNTISYLLLITTKIDIKILALNSDNKENILVYKTDLSCKLDGIEVGSIIFDNLNNNIYFSTRNDCHIWQLTYDNTNTSKNCYIHCTTGSFISNIIPTKFFTLFSSSSAEYFVKVVMDQSRRIIYGLTSRGDIKGYQFNKNKDTLKSPINLTRESFRTKCSRTKAQVLEGEHSKIVNIVPVSKNESSNFFLIAITASGCRVYINGNYSQQSYSYYSSDPHNLSTFNFTTSIKYPPFPKSQISGAVKNVKLINERDVLQYVQSKSSLLVKTSSEATIIEPGIFIAPHVKSKKQADGSIVKKHKILCSVPDYGILKENKNWIENAYYLDISSPVTAISFENSACNLKNNKKIPLGYSNVFANQYISNPLAIHLLTTSGLEIFKLKTPDEIFDELISASKFDGAINSKKKISKNHEPNSIGNNNPAYLFMIKYGLIEFFSTSLFNTIKVNNSTFLQNESLKLFLNTLSDYDSFEGNGSNSGLNGSTTVALSPKYYGIALLVSRLLRDIWNKPAFTKNPELKMSQDQYLRNELIKDNNAIDKKIISGINISKSQLEFYLSSIIILDEFLEKHEHLLTYNSSINNKKIKSNTKIVPENRIEIFIISSLLELIKSIKESLSFLNILYEESEIKGYDGHYLEFDSILKEVPVTSQYQLLGLTFKDLFESGNYGNLVKNQGFNKLIKEICSSIINKNLIKGYKIDNITNLLQQKCGTFCSNHDILGYKIAENLHKCKEIIELNNKNSHNKYSGDEHLDYQLTNCLILINKLYELNITELSSNNRNLRNDRFEDVFNNGGSKEFITSQIISIETCNDMLKDLITLLTSTNNLTPKAIKFLLNVCENIDKNNLAQQFIDSGSNPTDYRKIYYDERMKLYDLIFEILIKFDEFKASDKLRGLVYTLIFKANNDKIFQFTLYDWFINNNKSNDLLQLNNPSLLEYLTKEDNERSLDKRDLLWKYYIKINKFIEAAKVLFDLGIDHNLDLSLSKRLEYLTRANGLSKTKNINMNVSELNSNIELYLSVANIQFEILNMLANDTRNIPKELKNDMLTKLADTQILSCDQLFNEFSEPLSYNEISLLIFQLTNFKENDVIIDNWVKFFDNFKEFGNLLTLEKNFVKLGVKLNNNKCLFPVDKLAVLLIKFVNENFNNEEYEASEYIINLFIKCGISYEKLYYQFKVLMEQSDSQDIVNVLKKSIQILIQKWYYKDLSLRDFVDNSEKNLKTLVDKKEFDIKNDPIKEFLEN